jgi:excisionase family DNA binding protein
MVDEIKSADDLPVCLNVPDVAKYLGVSRSVAYKLVRQPGFPSIRVGEKRIVIPRDKFKEWIEKQVEKSL